MKTTATKVLERLAGFVTRVTGLRAVIVLKDDRGQVYTDGHIVALDHALQITRENPEWCFQGLRRF
jgi:hypothetical protein